MGKKEEREDIEDRLDVQMNLAQDLASRNPWMKELYEKYPNRFVDKVFNPSNEPFYEEFDKRFAEIYGDIFPTFAFPVLQLEELEKSPSKMVLRIDLNYTKDEIMQRVEQFVGLALKKYRENRTSKYTRKVPNIWRDYLEIWDLRDGYPPWIKDSKGIPFAPSYKKKRGPPWTLEEIAKYKYPNALEPKDLKRAVNRVKKQWRAACEFICGKKYDPNKIEEQKMLVTAKSGNEVLCDECPDRPHCNDLCPAMIRDLNKITVSQQHKIPDSSEKLDLEEYQTPRKKYPNADKQFK